MAVTSARAPICNELPLPPFGKMDVASGVQQFAADAAADSSGVQQFAADAAAAASSRQVVLAEVEKCREEIEGLHRKQDQMYKKQKEADEMRRGQLDSMTERIYQVEKDLRAAQQQQEEAIDKANAAFQMHAFEVQRDRQNLMSLITQINDKFDDVSEQLSRQSISMHATQESFADVQQEFQQECWNSQGDRATLASLGQDVTWLQEKVNEQQESIQQVHLIAEAARGSVANINFKDHFLEAESRHTKQIEELHNHLRALGSKFNEMQKELQDMQPKLLKVWKTADQSHVHELSKHAASQRTNYQSPGHNLYHDDVGAGLDNTERGMDRGGQDSQSSQGRSASQLYMDLEAPNEAIESPHVDHRDSLSWAMQNWPQPPEKPALHEAPAVTAACKWWSPKANVVQHDQYGALDGHQSSALGASSSQAYHGAADPYYSGRDSGTSGWDSNYDDDLDDNDLDDVHPDLYDVPRDVNRLPDHLDSGCMFLGASPRMPPDHHQILHLLRSGHYPPNHMSPNIGAEDVHL